MMEQTAIYTNMGNIKRYKYPQSCIYCMAVEQKHEQIQEQEDQKIEVEPKGVLLNSGEISEMADSVSDEISVVDFTATKSNLNHGHSPTKHDVRTKFGVTDEIIEEFFTGNGVLPNDHIAMWFMTEHKDALIESPVPVFEDTQDTDTERWNRIKNMRSSAPIPPQAQKEVKNITLS